MKKVAILQSNYIPWKGYFDLIAAVDEFVIYDVVQFTKNDWRNRNKIKAPSGLQWLSVPVGKAISRQINEVELKDQSWQRKHWASISQNYSRARCFSELAPQLEELYMAEQYSHLSLLNRRFIEFVTNYLGIETRISDSTSYEIEGEPTERLVQICQQAGAQTYLSGPAAGAYLDETQFAEAGIAVEWFDYHGYPEYNQLFGEFVHGVSVLDLLLNCGPDSPDYMKFQS